MRLVDARDLPAGPIDAAADFLGRIALEVRSAIQSRDLPLCVVFAPADHRHSAWRRAAIQELAREAAPGRINAIAGDDEVAVAAAADYLGGAPGVTGQYLPLDGAGAGNPVEPPR